MLKSEKEFYKKSQLKRKYWGKRMKADEVLNTLKKLINEKNNHIDAIDKEGISVVEYSLDKTDIKRLSEDMKKLKEVMHDMEILAGYYNVWLKK